MSSARYRAADGVLADQIDGKAVLVDPAGKEVLTLNATGSVVWTALSTEEATTDALAQRLVDEFDDVDPDAARRDVVTFLDELARLGLVTDEHGG